MSDGFIVRRGGGTSLNFKVVGNPQPSSPKENTIWVDTDTPIPSWEFSATQPTVEIADLYSSAQTYKSYYYYDENGTTKYSSAFNILEVTIPDEAKLLTVIANDSGSGGAFHLFYDASGNKISMVERNAGENVYAIPNGAVTVRISLRTNDTQSILFTIGEIYEGMVWFPSGTSSRTEFNALKKNRIMVYPSTAKQYVNGAWVQKAAQTYQGGKWVPWWDGVLYNRGTIDQFTTGGYTFWGGDSDCYCWSEGNGIKMYNSTYSTSYLVFNNRIDLAGVSKLQLVFDSVNTEYNGTTVSLLIGSNKSTSVNVLGQASKSKSYDSEVMSGTLTIDTSKIDGGYVYVKFYTTGNYNEGYFYIREVKAVLA